MSMYGSFLMMGGRLSSTPVILISLIPSTLFAPV
jgi:hypothetical protein